jgi:hypothetical protein
MRRTQKPPEHAEPRHEEPEPRPEFDEGIDESLELTYPASDPPRPVRVHPDSDTGAGRKPVGRRVRDGEET